MRKILLSFSLITILLLILHASAASAAEPALSAAEIISSINAYRAQNGLPAYQSNGTLMALAQGQSDYQASIGSVTHDGPGGTRPRDRAYAAGYGNGAIIFVSEIIYGGTNATVSTAMEWWKGSPIHNDTMLASTYQEIGAGVSTDGTWTYFTAEMAYVAGGVAPTLGPGDSPPDGGLPVIVIPVVVAESQEDGSIVHIVRTGQTLWAISAVYEIPLSDILALNGFPENPVIYPGDEILIVPAPNQTKTLTPSATIAAAPFTPTFTIQPSSTPQPATPIAALNPVDNASDQDEIDPSILPDSDLSENSTIRWIVIIAVVGIFLVFLGSMFLPGIEEV